MRSPASLLAVLLASLISASPVNKPHPVGSGYVSAVTQLTFFGYPDNCDSTGCYKNEAAYTCQNPDGSSRYTTTDNNGDSTPACGGDGSYNNPLTVAYHPGGVFSQCMIVYIGYLQKFGIVEGYCAACAGDHLDIWVQSTCSSDFQSVCGCENSLTPAQDTYVYYDINAENPDVFTVWNDALYDDSTKTCTTQFSTAWEVNSKIRSDAAGQLQSVNAARSVAQQLEPLNPKWKLSKRQSGNCQYNTCQCGC